MSMSGELQPAASSATRTCSFCQHTGLRLPCGRCSCCKGRWCQLHAQGGSALVAPCNKVDYAQRHACTLHASASSTKGGVHSDGRLLRPSSALQWWWTTANSCQVPGAPAYVGSDNMAWCNTPNVFPEEFFNCAGASGQSAKGGVGRVPHWGVAGVGEGPGMAALRAHTSRHSTGIRYSDLSFGLHTGSLQHCKCPAQYERVPVKSVWLGMPICPRCL